MEELLGLGVRFMLFLGMQTGHPSLGPPQVPFPEDSGDTDTSGL